MIWAKAELDHPKQTVTNWRALPWLALLPFVLIHAAMTGRSFRMFHHDRTIWGYHWPPANRQ